MSGQMQQQRAQYVGIINGIVYRIDGNGGRSGDRVELVPLEVEAAALNGRLGGSQNKCPPHRSALAGSASSETSSIADKLHTLAGVEAAIGQEPDPEPASQIRLFPRDGAEPLRAGHPDLWQLLVAGTCLEGSSFRSGWLEEPMVVGTGAGSPRAAKPGLPQGGPGSNGEPPAHRDGSLS